ncbi:hypothetical protein PRVXT_002356 [Proteinivorax tanatarense]|uniref:Uncharacterized protein n=1 Tax=Proteinivorax tanatarense TaxID=1260629 RepID=A0AAU7VKG9_9FIRM
MTYLIEGNSMEELCTFTCNDGFECGCFSDSSRCGGQLCNDRCTQCEFCGGQVCYPAQVMPLAE